MLAAFLGAALNAQTAPPPGAGQKPADQKSAEPAPTTGAVVIENVAPVNVAPVKVQEPAGVCSIPLKNVLRTDPHDKITITPGTPMGTHLPEVKLPAPPCDDAVRR